MSQQEVALELRPIQASDRGRFADFVKRFSRSKAAMLGLMILLVLALAGAFAPFVAPYDPLTLDAAAPREGPSLAHWFGTDEIGRDVLSRVIWGARRSLPVGIIPVAAAALIGTALGLISGYFGGWAETLIMRFIDIMMAFPGILLAVAVVAVLGTGLQNLMLAVGAFSMPLYARLVRGSTLAVKETVYVEAARSMGASDLRIVLRHILPNILAPLIVLITLGAAIAILAAAALSFLGLGAQPPEPEWGSMLNSSRRFLRIAWWMPVFPGAAITVTVLAMNMVGDTLRDVLDPRLRE